MGFRGILIDQEISHGKIVRHQATLCDVPESLLEGSVHAGRQGDLATAETASHNRGNASQTNGAQGSFVDIDVLYSGVNYKDGLAVGGRPGVARTSPLIPGIDCVGLVRDSESDRFTAGDLVVLTGGGIGESHHGGLAERARVSEEYLLAVPHGLSARQAAAIGTAGFTAMLSVLTLEGQGVTPESGPVIVTGAAGGVGSIAVAVLARLGYQVTALSGRAQTQGEYLRGLGASDVIDRQELAEPGPPLQKRRWAAGLDTVGSRILANVLAQTRDGGTVTTCGLTAGPDLPASMMPFILRGITLAGISSVYTPQAIREKVWQRLSTDLDLGLLDSMTAEIRLEDVPARAQDILAGSVRGRTVVAIGNESAM